MKTNKNLGIWMDHLNANLIDLDTVEEVNVITSKFNYSVKDEAIRNSEKGMHNKRQQLNEAYYKEISQEILKYDSVLLFGPTDAKTELHNFLNENLRFKDIKIEVKTTDKLTDKQIVAFVKSYFEE